MTPQTPSGQPLDPDIAVVLLGCCISCCLVGFFVVTLHCVFVVTPLLWWCWWWHQPTYDPSNMDSHCIYSWFPDITISCCSCIALLVLLVLPCWCFRADSAFVVTSLTLIQRFHCFHCILSWICLISTGHNMPKSMTEYAHFNNVNDSNATDDEMDII